jgi:hypothetical protein
MGVHDAEAQNDGCTQGVTVDENRELSIHLEEYSLQVLMHLFNGGAASYTARSSHSSLIVKDYLQTVFCEIVGNLRNKLLKGRQVR